MRKISGRRASARLACPASPADWEKTLPDKPRNNEDNDDTDLLGGEPVKEVDPADVIEQSIPVPLKDDYEGDIAEY
ncbi:hypothetical protein ACWDYJ_35490 [Streptomyces sp. NPDC003042]